MSLALSLSAFASENKIALVPGGPHPYFAPWKQAAIDAKKDFEIAVVDFKVPSEWKLNLQTELIESLRAQGYNAFGVFPGDAIGINSTVSELKDGGIPAIALGGCAAEPTEISFCLGTDVFNSAYLGTRELIKAMGGRGNIVHLAGSLVDPNSALRENGVQKAVSETNGAVTLLQTVADTDAQEAADQKINATLAAQKDEIDGMIATGYIQSVVASKLLRALGDKRIKLVGIDDDAVVLDAIRDGVISGTMVQNPYGQGYIGAYALDLLASGNCILKADAPWIRTPQTVRFIDSGTMFITKSSIETYRADLEKLTAAIRSRFKDTYLSCK
jgi:ribose transport system substrate-binding protein